MSKVKAEMQRQILKWHIHSYRHRNWDLVTSSRFLLRGLEFYARKIKWGRASWISVRLFSKDWNQLKSTWLLYGNIGIYFISIKCFILLGLLFFVHSIPSQTLFRIGLCSYWLLNKPILVLLLSSSSLPLIPPEAGNDASSPRFSPLPFLRSGVAHVWLRFGWSCGGGSGRQDSLLLEPNRRFRRFPCRVLCEIGAHILSFFATRFVEREESRPIVVPATEGVLPLLQRLAFPAPLRSVALPSCTRTGHVVRGRKKLQRNQREVGADFQRSGTGVSDPNHSRRRLGRWRCLHWAVPVSEGVRTAWGLAMVPVERQSSRAWVVEPRRANQSRWER